MRLKTTRSSISKWYHRNKTVLINVTGFIFCVFQISFDGNVPRIRPPFNYKRDWVKNREWQVKVAPYREHPEVRRNMIVEKGRVYSWLEDKFPECKPAAYKKAQQSQSSEE